MPDVAAAPDIDLTRSSSTRPFPSLRGLLREATAGAHARLDGLFAELNLAILGDYRRFLSSNAAALLPLESALERDGVKGAFVDWPARSRRGAIMTDLARVGRAVAPLRSPGDFSAGELHGALYVLEGSRLGARVLLTAVAASPDARVAGATAYLRHGEGLNLWSSFLATLEARASDLDPAEVTAGARRAFAFFEEAAASP